MRNDEGLVTNPTYVYGQFTQAGAQDLNLPIIANGSAITTISGATGPIVTFSGGTTGYSFAGAGAAVTLSGAAASIKETSGPTTLSIGAVPDGTFLERSGSTVVGASAEMLLATTILSLNTSTKQTLYTVPTGKSAIITKIIARSASVDLSGGVTTALSFGFNAGASDWTSANNFDTTKLTNSTLFKVMPQNYAGADNFGSVIGTAAQIFGAKTDAAFGSAATVVIMVYGNLF